LFAAAFGAIGFASSAYAQVPGVDMAAKAQAARAVAICDGAAWEAAATMYKNNHAKEAGPFGILALPADFPSYPFPCNPKTAAAPAATQTAVNPAIPVFPAGMTWVGPAPLGWGPYSPDNMIGGIYVGGSFAGNSSSSEASNARIFTLGVLDLVPTTPFSGTGTHVSGGVLLGLNMAQLFGFLFGVEFGADFADKNQTFIGNLANATTATNNDRVGFEYNNILSLSVVTTAPINRNFSVFVRGGPSWLNGNAQIGCSGSCTAAGTAPFNVNQEVDLNGWHWGVGAQGRIGTVLNRPVFLRGEFVQHTFNGTNVSAGNPATASVAFRVKPEVDQVKASLIVPLNWRL
jgi:hypothetical protein